MSETDASRVGLLGGDIEARARHSRIPPLDAPHVLAPFRRAGDEARVAAFVAHRPLEVEIGFGRSHFLTDLAALRSGAHLVGFEVRRRWCHAAVRKAARRELDNLRVIEGDARAFFERCFAPESIDTIYILFPDPWWKKRHHKRRIFRPDFVETVHRMLAPGGALVAKTDVPAYADLIDEEMGAHGGFRLVATSYGDPALAALPLSHREKKCRELGIPVFPFRFERV